MAASYAWYGVWGTAFIGWLAVYGGCSLLGRSGSVSPTVTDTDDATFDELATATEPDNDAQLFGPLMRLHGRANRSTNPNVPIVAAFREIMAYHVPELRGFDGFVAPHAQYLRDKDSLTELYVGTELVQRLNESSRAMLEQLRSLIGVEHYTTLMGTDEIMNIVNPELSNAAGYSDVQPTYDAKFISQNVPALMVADGRRYPVSIKMHNSGNQVWRPGRIRLRSENPTDNLTWGTNRINLPDAANVNPQSDVLFSFDVTPQTLGEQLFRWGMVREGVGPFGQKNDPVRVMVAKDALFLRQSVPATIVAGTTQSASVTFRNIGTVPWTRGTNFRLGSQGPANNTTWGLHRVELPRDKVDPNTEVTFEFPIKAPATAGKYNFQWQVLREQVAWLGQPSPAFEVRVMPPLTRAAVFVSQAVANPIHPGAVQIVAVTMQNVGTETWTGGDQFKLGSQNPTNNVRWGTNRVSLPHDVPPNAEVTFTFGINARDAVGTWNFQWQMLQGDSGWFGQITPNIEVHVATQQPPLLDLYFLKTRNVAQGKVEAHTATNSSRYTTGLSSVTRFSPGDADNGWFGMHRNGNIYFVKTKNTVSGKVEVFTATRSSGYTEGISAVSRFLVSDGANGRFGMLPNGNLYFIKTRNTGTGTIEAFTTLGPTYMTGLVTPTRFAAAEATNGWFGMLPTSDVYFIKTRNTGTGKIEVFTATSASGYTTGIQASTRLPDGEADNGPFGMLTNGDVYFVKTKNTAGKIEVFTATRASNYTTDLGAQTHFSYSEGINGTWGMM